MASRPVELLRRKARSLEARVRTRVKGHRDPIADLADLGLFDLEYYRAQLPPDQAPADREAAVAHYIATGRADGVGFHPFIEPEWWGGREEARPENVAAVQRVLADRHIYEASPSPLLAETREPVGEMVAFVRDTMSGRRTDVALPGGMSAPDTREAMLRALRSGWAAPNEGARSGVRWDEVATRQRVAGRVSALVPTFEDWAMTVDAVRAALAGAVDDDVEVIVVDNGSRPAVYRLLVAAFLVEPRVRIVRSTQNTNFSGGMNIALGLSTGEFVLLLNNDAVLEPGWVRPLLTALDDQDVRGVQPLLLYPGIARVQAAGTMFLGEGVVPWHFLAGHPIEDVERATDRRFHAVTAAVTLLRAAELVELRGFDEEYRNGYEDVDLCLRMLRRPADHFTVTLDARAHHPEGSSEGRSRFDSVNRRRFFDLWKGRLPAPEGWRYRAVGLELAGMRPHTYVPEVPIVISDPQLVRPRRRVDAGPGAGLPSLRWTLCLSVLPSDGELVTTLRSDLADLGQEVVSFVGGVRSADGLDDVLVAFAPDAPFAPRSATVNVLIADGAAADDAWDAVVPLSAGAQAYGRVASRETRLAALRELVLIAEAARAARFDAGGPPAAGSADDASAEPAQE